MYKIHFGTLDKAWWGSWHKVKEPGRSFRKVFDLTCPCSTTSEGNAISCNTLSILGYQAQRNDGETFRGSIWNMKSLCCTSSKAKIFAPQRCTLECIPLGPYETLVPHSFFTLSAAIHTRLNLSSHVLTYIRTPHIPFSRYQLPFTHRLNLYSHVLTHIRTPLTFWPLKIATDCPRMSPP